MTSIDFAYSSHKDFASLLPLYQYVASRGWNSRFFHIHKMKWRNRRTIRRISRTVIIAYDAPLSRLRRSGWNGEFIYVEHGLSPVKYYTYKYSFFHEAALLLYPGEVFKRKMAAVNPSFSRGVLAGYPKCDNLIRRRYVKSDLVKKYRLDPAKPVILFAPSWGSRQGAGVANMRYFKGIPNVIALPHPSEYRFARRYGARVPPEKSNVNQFIRCADLVVSDISSIVAEAALIGKTTLQLRLSNYPGCFPAPDRRTGGIFLSPELLAREAATTDRKERPFKIPFLDEDWDFGYSTEPATLPEAIEEALGNPGRFSEQRRYWATQSCWQADGNSCARMAALIAHFLATGEIGRQVEANISTTIAS